MTNNNNIHNLALSCHFTTSGCFSFTIGPKWGNVQPRSDGTWGSVGPGTEVDDLPLSVGRCRNSPVSSDDNVVDPAADPCRRRSFIDRLQSMWLILLQIPADDLPNSLRPRPGIRTCNLQGLDFLYSNTPRLSQPPTGTTLDCNEEKSK